MSESVRTSARQRLSRLRPWLILAVAAGAALWHTVDFPDDADPEYPGVVRPTFSRRPPPAYRLAEPGDTIDRVAIYFAAGAVVLSLAGLALSGRDRRLWPASLALGLAALWHAATPGPTFDGWHGLGWRTMFDPNVSAGLRSGLALGAVALAGVVVATLLARRSEWTRLRSTAREQGAEGLLVAALVLVALRQVEIPGVEPVGYWPRWAFTFGLLAFDLALIRMLRTLTVGHRLRRLAFLSAGALGWFGLVCGGIWLTWYHRPLERLKAIVPGRIYISAMPTARGLEVAHARHRFKTIINLFPEDTPLRSPRLPEELRFAADHGIRYVGSPADEAEANAFLDQTLALACDPDAWPILVHCHGCMDRTPAWAGIYRFVVQGRPLAEILREIERHRGYRPKGSVFVLYQRVLPPRAPERFAADPTARQLATWVVGAFDGSRRPARGRSARVNPEGSARVSGRTGPRAELPNLTPRRRSLEYQQTLPDPHLHEPSDPS